VVSWRFGLVLAMLFSAGCASQQILPLSGASEPWPAELAAAPDQQAKGRLFHWGGMVTEVRNYRDNSILVILAYPLGSNGRPDIGRRSVGRFLADSAGFIEPLAYPAGTLVEVSGPLLGFHDGQIGEAPYTFPALQLRELREWREAVEVRPTSPSWSIGVGGGSHGSHVGIGVGF